MKKHIHFHYFDELYKDLVIIQNNSYKNKNIVTIDIKYNYNPNNEIINIYYVQVKSNSVLAQIKNKKYFPLKSSMLSFSVSNKNFNGENQNLFISGGYVDDSGNIFITSNENNTNITFGYKNSLHIYGTYRI